MVVRALMIIVAGTGLAGCGDVGDWWTEKNQQSASPGPGETVAVPPRSKESIRGSAGRAAVELPPQCTPPANGRHNFYYSLIAATGDVLAACPPMLFEQPVFVDGRSIPQQDTETCDADNGDMLTRQCTLRRDIACDVRLHDVLTGEYFYAGYVQIAGALSHQSDGTWAGRVSITLPMANVVCPYDVGEHCTWAAASCP